MVGCMVADVASGFYTEKKMQVKIGSFPHVGVKIKHCLKPTEPRKKPSYFPLYWMVNRDRYNGLL